MSLELSSTPKTNMNSRWRIWGGFLFRLFVGLVIVIAVPQLIYLGLSKFLPVFLSVIFSILTGIGAYVVFVRLTESAPPRSLEISPAVIEFFLGAVSGVALSAASVGILWLIGAYRVVAVIPIAQWATAMVAAIPLSISSGVLEELAFRGVVARQIARTFNPLAAIVTSATLFGAVHLLNDNATLAVCIGLAVQAGVLLAIAYLATGRLWVAMGLHFAWNFMQAGIVGGALSGNKTHAIISAATSGPDWLSGGKFGIEGSIVTTAVCALGAVIYYVVANRRGLLWLQPATDL